jgi:CBS domain-containing protein
MSQTMQKNRTLAGLRVVDAMHPGLITCRPGDPLRTVARLMATYRVHAVFVTAHRDGEEGDRWGVVSDVAVLRAAREGSIDELTAGAIVETPVLSVSSSNELDAVADLMVERGLSHVVVVERHTKRPLGVLSTLDVARALAGFPERHPRRR